MQTAHQSQNAIVTADKRHYMLLTKAKVVSAEIHSNKQLNLWLQASSCSKPWRNSPISDHDYIKNKATVSVLMLTCCILKTPSFMEALEYVPLYHYICSRRASRCTRIIKRKHSSVPQHIPKIRFSTTNSV